MKWNARVILFRYPALALAARKAPIDRGWTNNSGLVALLLVATYFCVTIGLERSAQCSARRSNQSKWESI